MSPSLALLAWFLLLVGVLLFDPARPRGASSALWVPVVWLFIVGSRLPSQWLGGDIGHGAVEAGQEGDSIDRTIYFLLIMLSVGILVSRRFAWDRLFKRNIALTLLLVFALLSFAWSDFPFISLKRWFRDLGNYLIVLVILTDAKPVEAAGLVLRRLCYLLVPLSIVLVKYSPETARHYDAWTGVADTVGPTNRKNILGVACLISGLYLFWDTLVRWPDRKDSPTKRILLMNVAFMAMTLWLWSLSNSATSGLCLALGCGVIAEAQGKRAQWRRSLLKVMIPICICLYLVLAFGLESSVNAMLAKSVGRDPTLTGRSTIWDAVLSVDVNPIVGTGYEAFWLGPRLQEVWRKTGAGINEAHNGYIEVYLHQGLVGVFLLVGLLISSYRTICKRLDQFSPLGSFTLAVWTILPLYNVTESAFRSQLIMIIFLLGAIVVSGGAAARSLVTDDQRRIDLSTRTPVRFATQ